MATIARAYAQVDGIERADTAEELTTAFEHLTNCDPATDMLLATVHSGNGQAPQVIGYSRVTWREEGSGDRWYIFFGRIVPEWRRRGIGQAMLGWVEARLKQIADGHPPHIRKHFVCFAEQGEQGFAAMLEKSGYQPMRNSFEMLRPDLENIPDFPMPEGLEVRPVLPEHYRLIWDADTEAFRDHWGFVAPGEEDYQLWLTDFTVFQPELWQVAWDIDTGQVAGQVRTFIHHEQNRLYNRKRGYTEFISVRRPWRRRGLARALIVRIGLRKPPPPVADGAVERRGGVVLVDHHRRLAGFAHLEQEGAVGGPSGDDDEDFVRLMLPHHQAAIDMAAGGGTAGC